MNRRELLSRLNGLTVLVLGDAILDEYLYGDCLRISPEAPVPIVHVSGNRRVLGGAANTAANVASLGARAELIALVGRDAAGEELAAIAAKAGIDLTPVSDGRPTIRKTRVIGQHQQLVRLDYEDAYPLAGDAERVVMTLASERVGACDIVVLSDYAKGCLTQPICQHVIGEAHRHGRLVVVDPRPEHGDFYRGADYITPNLREAKALVGKPVDGAPEVEETGRELVERLGTNVLMTLGAQGMAFFGRDGRERLSLPTVAREVFDVSGAGDTVASTFALARAAGAGHREAMDLANAAAGIVVGKFGTATVRPDELLLDLEAGGRLVSRAELAPLAAGLRRTGKRIVTVNGSFDLLHVGHLHVLREAKRQGDVLVVGLNSDRSIRGYKGLDRPIIPEGQREQMLLALRDVDYVHRFDEQVPMAFLEEIRPDVHVNGAEYGDECIEAPTVRRYGGRIHLVERIPEFSTTRLIGQLRAALVHGATS